MSEQTNEPSEETLMIRVTYRIAYGPNQYGRQEESYHGLDEARKGIQERVGDPFQSPVQEVIVSDHRGRAYDVSWSASLAPRAQTQSELQAEAQAQAKQQAVVAQAPADGVL